jgi:predicted Fe-Mo cluster-binding NifX family protein
MRIAVAANERNENADISSRAARAPFYFIYDAGNRAVDVIANPFSQRERAMGLRMADFLASKGVKLVIAQRFGSAFVEALERKGMRSAVMQGSVGAAAAKARDDIGTGDRARRGK